MTHDMAKPARPAKPEQSAKDARPATACRGGRVVHAVRPLLDPVAREMGYFLWDVEYVREGGDYVLRITLDAEGDECITLNDCEAFTRAVDPILDEADPIDGAYLLEVSSPGVERSLREAVHFERCAGQRAELRLFAPVDGRKVWVGLLRGLDDAGSVRMDVDADASGQARERVFPREMIARAHTLFDFGGLPNGD